VKRKPRGNLTNAFDDLILKEFLVGVVNDDVTPDTDGAGMAAESVHIVPLPATRRPLEWTMA
jgi:hypothetical protein